MRPIRSDRYRSPPYNLHRLMTSITLLRGLGPLASPADSPLRRQQHASEFRDRIFRTNPFHNLILSLVIYIYIFVEGGLCFFLGGGGGVARTGFEKLRGGGGREGWSGVRRFVGRLFGSTPFSIVPLDSHNSVGSLSEERESERICVCGRAKACINTRGEARITSYGR